MTIQRNLELIHKHIFQCATKCGRDPSSIQLVAVSKRFPIEAILEARSTGHVVFGENYLQEAAEKKAILGDSVRFHFIGHLQSNKAKTAAEIFDMVETIDRFKIAAALNRNLMAIDRKLDILIQVNIGRDPHKSGILPESAANLLEQIKDLKYLTPKGLMTITPITQTVEDSRTYFQQLRILGEKLQSEGLLPENKLELSMGMSSDYHVAIEEGATLIRIGTSIFGQRPPR